MLTDGTIQSPEIQTMYSLNIPVSHIRTKIREQFERHRYVNQLHVVDVLLFQSDAEFQVWPNILEQDGFGRGLIRRGLGLTDGIAGNAELLETTPACDEVFQKGRGSVGEVVKGFHRWVFGSKSLVSASKFVMLTSLVCREGIRRSSFSFVRYTKRHGVHSTKPSKQRQCNATFTPYRMALGVSLRLHVVLSKCISGFGELLCYNVTCIHQVVQTFF